MWGNTFCVLPNVASVVVVVTVAEGFDCKAVHHHTGGEPAENLHMG